MKINIHTEHIKIFILLGLIGLTLIFIRFNNVVDRINFENPTTLGISFSPAYTKALGLDPKIVYASIFKDLNIKTIRLAAYWDEIESKPNYFNFKDLEFYIDEAKKNNTEVVLAVGYKLPRWPECRSPLWLDSKNIKIRQERQLLMVKSVTTYFENNPNIKAWQIENEPLLPFGDCPEADREFLKTEVELVRSISKKPIIITDSGELRPWVTPMTLSDYFGTTLYKTVRNPILGYLTYPTKPWFYRIKSEIIRGIFAPSNQKTIISELQAEPWSDSFITQMPIEEQLQNFPVEQLSKNVEFAKKVGFDSVYLWGVEWWYYMETKNHPEYLEKAKEIFNDI